MNETLTKREQFAMMAMQGMLANSYFCGYAVPLSEGSAESIAELAFFQADLMIAESAKVQGVI
jgi:hypothetical protein